MKLQNPFVTAGYAGVTWYLQAVLNKVWEGGRSLESVAQIEAASDELVEERALVYHDLLASRAFKVRSVTRSLANFFIKGYHGGK